MPVYLRAFYTKKLVEAKETEKKEMDKMKSKSKAPSIPRR